jgi:flagellar motor switch protein FliM
MMSSASPPIDPFGVVTEGPVRRAVATIDRYGAELAGALRRAAPFLVRRGIPIAHEPAALSTPNQTQAGLEGPTFAAHFTTDPGGVRGLLLFDGSFVAFLLDGLLGGDGASAHKIDLESLTAPQRILMGRLAEGVLQGMSPILQGAAGFRLRRLTTSDDAAADSAAIAKIFRAGEDGASGAAVLLIGNDAFAATLDAAPEATKIDPRVACSLGSAEIELIAELGRVRMTLGDLSALRVGHVLRTKVPVGGRVQIRAADQVLFEGYPVTTGTQIAIRLAGGTRLDAGCKATDSEKEASRHE